MRRPRLGLPSPVPNVSLKPNPKCNSILSRHLSELIPKYRRCEQCAGCGTRGQETYDALTIAGKLILPVSLPIFLLLEQIFLLELDLFSATFFAFAHVSLVFALRKNPSSYPLRSPYRYLSFPDSYSGTSFGKSEKKGRSGNGVVWVDGHAYRVRSPCPPISLSSCGLKRAVRFVRRQEGCGEQLECGGST